MASNSSNEGSINKENENRNPAISDNPETQSHYIEHDKIQNHNEFNKFMRINR